jgi:uncharacterized membrane protein
MTYFLNNIKLPAIISFILVVPFIILELVNRRSYHEGFPFVLFGILWILPIAFILMLTPIIRNVQSGKSISSNPYSLLVRIILMVFTAWVWTAAIIDQMPCFLGLAKCD